MNKARLTKKGSITRKVSVRKRGKVAVKKRGRDSSIATGKNVFATSKKVGIAQSTIARMATYSENIMKHINNDHKEIEAAISIGEKKPVILAKKYKDIKM